MSPRALCSLLVLVVLSHAGCEAEPAGERPDAGPGGGEDAGPEPFAVDLFGVVGHELRFVVSPDQAQMMEESGGWDPGFEDQYEIGGGGTYADDLVVTDAEDGQSHAFGQIELKLIGQSSFRPWKRIPNLRIDMDEFQPGLRIDEVEHLRLNNGQVGGIYREAIALRLWGALGYPVPRTSFTWVEAPNQWGEEVRVPYTMVEVYKPAWCDRSMPGCRNVWEGPGDIESMPGQCQFAACEEDRLMGLIELLAWTPPGPGFTAATEEWIDWDAFRTFQCLSWITATGDDYIHNNNNLVLVERDDGRFQLLPYSVDISAGQSWYPEVSLMGWSRLSSGCQNDPDCWGALLDRCDALLDAYDAMDVVGTIVDPVIAAVEAAGMVRAGDPARAEELRSWYAWRSAALRADPVWEAQPCADHETCEAREDGKTYCDGVCTEPPPDCTFEPCPDGFWCDEFGACHPF